MMRQRGLPGRRNRIRVASAAVLLGLATYVLCMGGVAQGALSATQAERALVALGDSFSSGEGNPPFNQGAGGATCHRSASAWPNLVAAQSGTVSLLSNIACTGAKTGDLFATYKGQPAQATTLQGLAASTNIVTVTIGGNDAGFSSVLSNCFLVDCARNGRLTQAGIDITALRTSLVSVFQRLHAAAPGARLVVVGYPQLFPATQAQVTNCGWLGSQERAGLNTMAGQLDAAEQFAATQAGVAYVSVLPALSAHELCTSASWVVPLQLLCVINSQCAHPILAGQQAIANIVRSYLEQS